MKKVRADVLLFELELVPSRARAQALILAGKVFEGDRRIEKAGEFIAPDAQLRVKGDDQPFVSRGGTKLAGALDAFAIPLAQLVAADFGASTGGFTDCLLSRGVARVYAIDVGYGQLHDKLRRDMRVVVMERCNARHLKAEDLPKTMDLIVIDASFIGLGKLLPAAHALLRPAGDVVALVKPQFEVGREAIGKRGVVRDEVARGAAIERVLLDAEGIGFSSMGRQDAVIKGPEGNQEHFVWLRKA